MKQMLKLLIDTVELRTLPPWKDVDHIVVNGVRDFNCSVWSAYHGSR